MFRNVLVPVDRSPFAETAIPVAASLARKHGGTLFLAMVHTVTVPDALRGAVLPPGGTLDQDIRREEQKYLDGLALRVASEFGVETVATLLDGPIASALHDHVLNLEIDLVVLSTHGRSGLQRAWLGSVTDRLVRTLTVPLLLVRPDEVTDLRAPREFRRVLVGLDGSALAEEALRAAHAIASHGAHCTAVRVAVPPQGPGSSYIPDAARFNREVLAEEKRLAGDYLLAIAERVRGDWSDVDVRVVPATHPERVLVDMAAEVDADVIAIATHGRGPVMRALIGSVTDRVARLSPVPVLVVPARASAAHMAAGHLTGLEAEILAR